LGGEILKLVDFAEFKGDSADAEIDGAIGVTNVGVESASDAFGDDGEIGFFGATAQDFDLVEGRLSLVDQVLEAIGVEGEEEFAEEGAELLFGDAGEDLGELLGGEVFEEVAEEGKLLGLGEVGECLDKLRIRVVRWLVHWLKEVKGSRVNKSDSTLSQMLGMGSWRAIVFIVGLNFIANAVIRLLALKM
jgi:hypothetical protein